MSPRSAPVVSLVLAFAFLASCTIIIKENPTPTPIPVGPGLCESPGEDETTAHVIFAVRVDRTIVGLADAYSRWFQKAAIGLIGVGVRTTRAVLVEVDERKIPVRPLAAWGCDVGGFELDPEMVLRYYAEAARPEGTPSGCAVDPLLAAGSDMSAMVTQYPSAIQAASGVRVFGPKPDMVLVVHVDSLARKVAFSEAGCRNAARFAEVTEEGLASWIQYAGGDRLPFERVFHWFITTDEGVDRDTFVDRCRKVEGFPTGVLDVLEPSQRALYQPLGEAIERSGRDVASTSLCAMLSSNEEKAFFQKELGAIGSELGTAGDEELLKEILESGEPIAVLRDRIAREGGGELGPGSISLPGRPPGG